MKKPSGSGEFPATEADQSVQKIFNLPQTVRQHMYIYMLYIHSYSQNQT